MWAGASGFTLSNSIPPISNLHQGDSDTLFGDDGFDFEAFHYIPFTIQTESDDHAHVTQRNLKAINEKLDSLINSSTASSSAAYSQEAVKPILDTLDKEHIESLEKANKVVED